ncbi:MAG: uracil-DNA glycosylase [Desulfotalea sp.]
MSAPVCTKCVYFYLTHQYGKPYGCRAMGFKSKTSPSSVVKASSGMECQMFENKFPVKKDDGKFYA